MDYVLTRSVNPALSAPPPPTPPLKIHINNFIFVSGVAVFFFAMANCFIVQSRSKTTQAIIDSLVEGESEKPMNKKQGREGIPLLVSGTVSTKR